MYRDYNKAIQYLKQAAALEPTAAVNHYQLYKVLQRQHNHVAALEEIRMATDLDEQYRPYKAKLLVATGQCDRAVQEYQLYEQNVKKKNNSGEEKGGEVSSEVMKDMETALRCNQVLQSADAAFVNQDYKAAAHLFQQAIGFVESGSNTDDLVWPRAQSLFHLGDFYGVVSEDWKDIEA